MDDNVLLIFFSMMFLISAACMLMQRESYAAPVAPEQLDLSQYLGGFRENPACGLNDVPDLMEAQKMVWNNTYDDGWIYSMYGWTAGNRGRIKNIG